MRQMARLMLQAVRIIGSGGVMPAIADDAISTINELEERIAELEKENEWLFDFALGYTNAPFLVECLEALKEQGK